MSPSTASGAESLVIGVGEAIEAGQMYADLCARPFLALPDSREFLDLFSIGVRSIFVLLPYKDFSFSFVNSSNAIASATGTPLGIFPCGTSGQDFVVEARRLAQLSLAKSEYQHSMTSYSDFIQDGVRDDQFGASESDLLMSRLRSGSDAVILHTHGNGADLRLGKHVLCVQADHLKSNSKDLEGRRVLPCQVGGRCRVEHRSFSSFSGASLLRTRILVLISCWGISPIDAMLDASALLWTALLRGEDIQAIVGSTRINLTTPETAGEVQSQLLSGRSVGEVALLLNGSGLSADPSYVCVGDPETRLQSIPAHERELASLRIRLPEVTRSSSQYVSAHRDLNSAASRTVERRSQSKLVLMAAKDIGTFDADLLSSRLLGEASQWQSIGSVDSDDVRTLDKLFCEFLSQVLRLRGPDTHEYFSEIYGYMPEQKTSEKHTCGKNLFVLGLASRDKYSNDRELWFCERCGKIAECGRDENRAKIRSVGSVLFVESTEFEGGWLTAVLAPVGGHAEARSEMVMLTRDTSIEIEPSSVGLEAGVRRVGVAIVHHGRYQVLQTAWPE